MPKKFICTKCKSLFDDGKFCSNCGNKLSINPEWQLEQDKKAKEELAQKQKDASNEKKMLSIINTYRPYKQAIISAVNEFYNSEYGIGKALSKLCNYIAQYDKGDKNSLLRWYNDYCISKYSECLESEANKALKYLAFIPDGKSEIVRELKDRVYKIKEQYSYYKLKSSFKEEQIKNIRNSYQNLRATELAKLYAGALIENEIINAFLEGGTFSVDIEKVERSKPTTLDYIYYFDVTRAKYKYSNGALDRIKYDIDYEFDDAKAGLEALRVALDLENFEKCVKFYVEIYENRNSKYGHISSECFFTRESYGIYVLKFKPNIFSGAKIIDTHVYSGGEHH